MQHYRDQHPDWRVMHDSINAFRNNDRPWQTAAPDGLVFAGELFDDGPLHLLEIKSVHPEKVREWREGVPPSYYAQTQWQMDTLGVDTCVVAMSSGYELFDRKPREYVIEYDLACAEWLRGQALKFLDMLDMDIEPAADYNLACDREVLRHKHPVIDDSGVEIPDDLARQYLAALAAADTAVDAKARWSAELAAFLGDSKKATWQGVTLGSRKAGRNGNPPSFSAAPKLADRATELLNPKAA